MIAGSDDDDDNVDSGPCHTQQETNTYGSNDCLLVIPVHIDSPAVSQESTPYSILVPLVKKLSSILDGNCTGEELQQYNDMLSNAIAKKKNEIMKKVGQPLGRWSLLAFATIHD